MSASVLIVEDERIIAKGIEKQLKGLGYAVAGSAGTGADAIRLAADARPDLILMDVNLGGEPDGIGAAEVIRAARDVPIVFLTAHSDGDTLNRAKRVGPFGYVLKPYEDTELKVAIELALYKHQMDRRMRENEQWLSATLASIGDGVIATDAKGRVRFLNALAERLTGWPEADAAGRDARDVFRILNERTRAAVPNPIFAALESGASAGLPGETVLVARDGTERPIDDSAAPIRDARGAVSGAVMVFRDVSERRRLEAHLRQAQKMEAIGRLAGGIAHDFNNIMTVITGFSDLLLDPATPAEERDGFLTNIRDAGQRAAGLTQQIMAFSRKQMLVPAVLNLNAIVRDTGALVKRLIGAHIEFVVAPGADLAPVKADPTQLGQVLLNLAANARDAMPAGGRLEVRTANADLGPAVARDHPDVQPGRYVLLSVRDTGTGMTPEVLAQAFEPFFTTKAVGAGTGLGLATVHGIVKQSGGHIEVSSAPGAGTEFRVFLPAVPEPVAPPPKTPTPLPTGTETVLLVEDEDLVRRMTRRILERAGYTVLEAANGADAERAAEAQSAPVPLLITDLVMPGVSGGALAERLLARGLVRRVLYMSGYTEDEVARHGIETAEVEFIAKPFAVADFAKKVRAVLDRP
jgi:two-component system, cell cycle sensor histidine kinase and response regulator CckA